MPGKPSKPELSPADIAREAFRRLATRRIAPTPQAYQEIYEEIAGKPQQESSPSTSANAVTLSATEVAEPATSPVLGSSKSMPVAQSVNLNAGRPQLDEEPAAAHRAASIARVDDAPLLAAARNDTAAGLGTSLKEDAGSRTEATLRDLLSRTLSLGVSSLLRADPELAKDAESLARAVKEQIDDAALGQIGNKLKQLCFKIESRSEEMAEEHEMLLRLFKLLLDNVSELVDDDAWVGGQIAGVQDLLSGPLSHSALIDATRSLKEVIYKQGILKHSLTEAKVTVKNMMITFIDRIGAVADSTGDYHKKIDQYSHKISQAQDIAELNSVLDDVMRDTKIAQGEALRSRDEMVSARKDVQEAEARIQDLEGKLEQMSELVREDQLTGSLNRRGLDDVFERELARSERRKSPLCIALLDLDDFKRLNDTHGHSAGDEALVHLVRVVKDTLRTMDVIARFGGEEFLIVLPDTALADALQTITRLQRELTRRIFMHNNTKLLITFSAGVAIRAQGEDQASLIKRADAALYKAKKAGKNRVAEAD